MRDSSPQSRAFSFVFIMMMNADARIRVLNSLQLLASAIIRGVIDNNQLSNLRLKQNNFHDTCQSGAFVENRHDDGKTAFTHGDLIN